MVKWLLKELKMPNFIFQCSYDHMQQDASGNVHYKVGDIYNPNSPPKNKKHAWIAYGYTYEYCLKIIENQPRLKYFKPIIIKDEEIK